MNTAENLATSGTQYTGQINVREPRRPIKNKHCGEPGNIGYTRGGKPNKNTICVGHHYEQTNIEKT